MAVTFDAISHGFSGTNLSIDNTSLNATGGATAAFINVGAGATLLLVGINVVGAPATFGTITMSWDSGGTNQSMSPLAAILSNSGGSGLLATQMFGLINPTAGNLALGWGASGTVGQNTDLFAISFKGTITTSVAAATTIATNSAASGTSLSVSTAAAVASGDMAMTLWAVNAGMTGFPSDGGTARDDIFTGFFAYETYNGAGSIINATGTGSSSDSWNALIVGIKAPAAAGDTLVGAMPLFMI